MNSEDITPRTRQRDIREKRLKYFSKQNSESFSQQKNARQKGILAAKDTHQVFQPPDKRHFNKTNKSLKQQKPAFYSHSGNIKQNSNKSYCANSEFKIDEDTSLNIVDPELSDDNIEDDLSTHRPESDTSRTTELLIESCKNYKDILQEREQEKNLKGGICNGEIIHKDSTFDYETARKKLLKSRQRVAEIEMTLQSQDDDSDADTKLTPKIKERRPVNDAGAQSSSLNGSVKVALTSDQIYEMAKCKSNINSTENHQPGVVENILNHCDSVKQFHKDIRRSSQNLKKNNKVFETALLNMETNYSSSTSHYQGKFNKESVIEPLESEQLTQADNCDSLSNVESCLSLGMLDEQLKRIGVNPNVIRWATKSQPCVDIDLSEEDSGVEYFRRCPECCARNKCTITWCLNCGTVLIGIEAEAAPKSSKRLSAENRKPSDERKQPHVNEKLEVKFKSEMDASTPYNSSLKANPTTEDSNVNYSEVSNPVKIDETDTDCAVDTGAAATDADNEDMKLIDVEETNAFHSIDDSWSSDEDCPIELNEELKLVLNESVDIENCEEMNAIPFDIPVLDDADYREICSNNAKTTSSRVPPLNLDDSPRPTVNNNEVAAFRPADKDEEFSHRLFDSSTRRSESSSVNTSNRYYHRKMRDFNTNNSAGCNKTTDTTDLGELSGGARGGQEHNDFGRGDNSNRSTTKHRKNFHFNRKRNDSDRTYYKDRNRFNNRNRNRSENLGNANECSNSQRHKGASGGSAISQRRWLSSSNQWSDHHPSVLQKKPSEYVRQSYNKSNSFHENSAIRTIDNDDDDSYISMCLAQKNDNTSSNFDQDNNSLSSRRSVLPKYDMIESLFTPRALARLNLYTNGEIVSSCQDISQSTQDILKPRGWQEGDSPWLYLPDEIWLRIFKKLTLDSLACVSATCSTLHRIAEDGCLWRTIHLHRQHNLCNNHMTSIGKRKPTVLSLQNCHGDNITLLGLKNMFLECAESLQKLSFISCSKGAFQGDQLLLLSAVYCQNLREVDASYAQNVRDTTVASLAEASLCLEKLHLNGAQNITDEGISALVNYHRDFLLSLELYGCFNLTSNSLRSISQCSKLQALSLGSLTKLSGTSITEMVSKLHCLKTLDLRGAGKHVADATICEMATKSANMENLVLANIDRVTDRCIQTVADHMPKLRSLDLCGCTRVGNKGVESLAKKCVKLEELDLSSTAVDEKGVFFLATYSKNSLRCLRMNFCKNIGEESLIKLVKNCKRLESIYLYGNNRVCNIRSLTAINDKLVIKQDD